MNKTEPSSEELQSMFPGWSFARKHVFEVVALAIPILGIAGFAAGASFIEGWSRAAGISTSLFPLGVNETILAGLKLSRPWKYSGALLAFVISYIYLLEIITEWDRAKWGRQNLMQRLKRKRIAKSARIERNLNGLQARRNGSANMAWTALGPRRRWDFSVRAMTLKTKRWRRFGIRVMAFIMLLGAIALALLFHFLLKGFLVEESRAEGVRAYAQLYVAVSGKLPSQFTDKLDIPQLKEFACAGEEDLWQYRSIEIAAPGDKPEATKRQAYVVHSTDRLFFLLDKDGSTLHSFADTPFTLRESTSRPMSQLAVNCKKTVAKK